MVGVEINHVVLGMLAIFTMNLQRSKMFICLDKVPVNHTLINRYHDGTSNLLSIKRSIQEREVQGLSLWKEVQCGEMVPLQKLTLCWKLMFTGECRAL